MKTSYFDKTGYLEFFYKTGPNYADYAGPDDLVTVFHDEDTDEIIGFGIEDIKHLGFINLAIEDKLAVVMKVLRSQKQLKQDEFVEFLNEEFTKAGVPFTLQLRSYQKIESAEKDSGAIGLAFISGVSKVFNDFDWRILFSNPEVKTA